MRKLIVSGTVLAAALAAGPSVEAAIPIYEWGATIPPQTRAVLQNDVVCQFRCSGDPTTLCDYLDEDDVCLGKRLCTGDVFRLGRGSVLDLGGHTIEAAYQEPAVYCGSATTDKGRCTVKNGTIVGGKGVGVGSAALDIVVQDLTIDYMDSAIFGGGRVVARRLVIDSGRENTVYGARGVILRDVVANGEWVIRSGRDMRVHNVVLGPDGGFLQAVGRISGRGVEMLGSRWIRARDVVLRNVKSGPGKFSPNPQSLISADRRLRLVDADVVTIESGRKPQLAHTTCKHSVVVGAPSASWGVCAFDP